MTKGHVLFIACHMPFLTKVDVDILFQPADFDEPRWQEGSISVRIDVSSLLYFPASQVSHSIFLALLHPAESS